MSQQTIVLRKDTQTSASLPARPNFSPRSFGEQTPDQGAGAGHSLSRLSMLRPQTKLTVNQPGDKYEQEADTVADHVMRMGDFESVQRAGGEEDEEEKVQMKPLAGTISPLVQREGNEEEEDEEHRKPVQAKALPGVTGLLQREGEEDEEEKPVQAQRKECGGAQSADVSGVVAQGLSGGGQPLDDATRAFMEPRFGHDFSKVRIHTDSRASQSSEQIAARAYTVGSDIAFRSGEFSPGSSEGKRLLAHELTHVVQQGSSAQTRMTRRQVMRAPDNATAQPADPGTSAIPLQGGASAAGATTIKLTPITRALSAPNLSQLWDVMTKSGTRESASVLPKFEPAPQYEYDAQKRVTRALLTVVENKEMPQWTELPQQCSPIQAEWNKFYSALDGHESHHVEIDKKHFTNLHTRLIGKEDSAAWKIVDDEITAADQENAAYDAKSANGVNEGAKINSAVQCAPEKVKSAGGPPDTGDQADSGDSGANPALPPTAQAKRFDETVVQRACAGPGNCDCPDCREEYKGIVARSAEALPASAIGRHVLFSSGEHAQGTSMTDRLSAQKLPNTIQQGAVGVHRDTTSTSAPSIPAPRNPGIASPAAVPKPVNMDGGVPYTGKQPLSPVLVGTKLAPDSAGLNEVLNRMIVEQNQAKMGAWVDGLDAWIANEETDLKTDDERRKEGAGDVSGAPLPDAAERQQQLPIKKDVVAKLKVERINWDGKITAFHAQYDSTLKNTVSEMLDKSEQQIHTEAQKYGIVLNATGNKGRPPLNSAIHMPGDDKRAELKKRAQELIKLRKQQTKEQTLAAALLTPPSGLYEKKKQDAQKQHALIADHPVLGIYLKDEEKLQELAYGTDPYNSVEKELNNKLDNIAVVRGDMNDKLDKLKSDGRIRDATKRSMLIPEGTWESNVITEETKTLAEDAATAEAVKGAIGLALLAVSLVPGGALVATGAGLLMMGADIYSQWESFMWEDAASGTSLDRALAISQSDPSLWRLGVQIALSLGEGVVTTEAIMGAIKTFKLLGEIAHEALEARAAGRIASEAITRLREVGNGESAGLGDRVVNEIKTGQFKEEQGAIAKEKALEHAPGAKGEVLEQTPVDDLVTKEQHTIKILEDGRVVRCSQCEILSQSAQRRMTDYGLENMTEAQRVRANDIIQRARGLETEAARLARAKKGAAPAEAADIQKQLKDVTAKLKAVDSDAGVMEGEIREMARVETRQAQFDRRVDAAHAALPEAQGIQDARGLMAKDLGVNLPDDSVQRIARDAAKPGADPIQVKGAVMEELNAVKQREQANTLNRDEKTTLNEFVVEDRIRTWEQGRKVTDGMVVEWTPEKDAVTIKGRIPEVKSGELSAKGLDSAQDKMTGKFAKETRQQALEMARERVLGINDEDLAAYNARVEAMTPAEKSAVNAEAELIFKQLQSDEVQTESTGQIERTRARMPEFLSIDGQKVRVLNSNSIQEPKAVLPKDVQPGRKDTDHLDQTTQQLIKAAENIIDFMKKRNYSH